MEPRLTRGPQNPRPAVRRLARKPQKLSRVSFDAVASPVAADRLKSFFEQAFDGELQGRIDEVADALAAGAPSATLELINAIAAETDPGSGARSLERPLLYWAAVSTRIVREDFAQAMAELDQRIHDEEAQDDTNWAATDDGLLYLEALASGLVPLAGLDLAATLDYAKVYMDNFPPFSRPLGDVDERAARWLAQLLDVGAIRTTLRALMVALAGAFEEPYPRASSQVARWAEEPVPDDPTQDRRWMRALVVMARTQV